MLILLTLTGCSSSTGANEDLFKFKDSYIGDNTAVGNLVYQLPNGEHVEEIELKTKEKPYGLVLTYEDKEETMTDDIVKKTVITNTSFIFALVQNVDWITFDFGDQTYTVTREELEDWYGTELAQFTDEENL